LEQSGSLGGVDYAITGLGDGEDVLAVLVDHLETVEHGFQRFLIDVFEVDTASEQRTGSVNGGLGSGLAIHEAGDLPGEGLLGLALAGVGLGFLDQSFDFGLGQEG
ncbi:hypothetical protein LIR44_22455, partial [Bacteroides fragilis]